MAQAVEVAYKQLQRQLSGQSPLRLACGCSVISDTHPIDLTTSPEGTVIKATCGVCGKAIGAPILVGPT